ncbi:unnamed protein product, partial [Mesorhabditis spiculigera]
MAVAAGCKGEGCLALPCKRSTSDCVKGSYCKDQRCQVLPDGACVRDEDCPSGKCEPIACGPRDALNQCLSPTKGLKLMSESKSMCRKLKLKAPQACNVNSDCSKGDYCHIKENGDRLCTHLPDGHCTGDRDCPSSICLQEPKFCLGRNCFGTCH